MAGTAKYYVVYSKKDKDRPWVVMVSAPHTSGSGGTSIKRFSTKKKAKKHGKKLAKRNNERLAVNRRDGATTQHYDYT